MQFRNYNIYMKNGYPSIWDNGNEIYIHRLVMSEHIGRPLESNEIIHHKDEDIWNWDIDNLELTNRSDHAIHHNPELEKIPCKYCGEMFQPEKNKTKYCTTKCAGLAKRKFDLDKDTLSMLVWQKPTSQLARELGVSDVAIAKRCKLLGIEKPPRGYWSKLSGCS